MTSALQTTNGEARSIAVAEAVPPHDDAIEAAVLEALLKEPTRFGELSIGADDFYNEANRVVFRHIADTCAASGEPDMIRIVDSIKNSPRDAAQISAYHENGWVAYVAALYQGASPGNATYYAERLTDLSVRRRLQRTGIRLQQLAHDRGRRPLADVLSEASVELSDALTGTTTSQPDPPRFLSKDELARRLGQPVHRITYLIDSRNVRPTARAGIARVFTESDLDFLASEIRQIDVEREALPG